MTLGKWTVISRLLGFIRDAAIAALLGGGWLADAFLVAFRLPNFFRRLTAEGVLAYAFIPAYHVAKNKGPSSAVEFVRSTTFALVCLVALPSGLAMLWPESIVTILAPGLALHPETFKTASALLRLSTLYLPLAAAAAAASSFLMAEGEFQSSGMSPVILNMTIIAALAAAYVFYGAGTLDAAYVLCGGIAVGGFMQWAFQIPAMRNKSIGLYGKVSLKNAIVKKTFYTLPGLAVGASGNQLNILIATFFASFLNQGSISSLYFAERLIEFPLGIIGATLGLTTLADLSSLATSITQNKTAKERFELHLTNSVRLAFFFGLPAAVGTACLGNSLTALIFGHGAFDVQALSQTTSSLAAYCFGLPALTVIRPLLAGLAAINVPKSTALGAALGAALTVGFSSFAVLENISWGPAFAVSCASWVNAAVLVTSLRSNGFRVLPRRSWFIKVCCACGIMGTTVLFLAAMAETHAVRILVAIPGGIALYLAVTLLAGLEESRVTLQRTYAFLRRRT